MRQPALSEAELDAMQLLADGYVLTRRISESRSLTWPAEPVEQISSKLVAPSGAHLVRVLPQRPARTLIEQQLVKPRSCEQLDECTTLTEYILSAKGRRALLECRTRPESRS